jgi:hypothetical protein
LRRGKISQVDIGIGNEAGQQDDRIHEKARAVGHRGKERDQKEPINQVMHPKRDQGQTSQFWLADCISRIFLEPREPHGCMKLEDYSKQRA